jgi:hypothetical protein
MFQLERDNDFHTGFAKLTGSVDADPVGFNVFGRGPRCCAAPPFGYYLRAPIYAT